MAELQKDPITRSEFLGFGVLGTLVGAILTIPSAAFVLSPLIKTEFQGQSDVSDAWEQVGPVSEVPANVPKVFKVAFPIKQLYAQKGFTIENAVWVSWKDGKVPSGLAGGPLSPAQIQQYTNSINVMSSSCAHLGCPVRWIPAQNLFLCPCHGGLYDVNGGYVGGPPPRGLFRYTYEIRNDGNLYVKHQFDGKPYVV